MLEQNMTNSNIAEIFFCLIFCIRIYKHPTSNMVKPSLKNSKSKQKIQTWKETEFKLLLLPFCIRKYTYKRTKWSNEGLFRTIYVRFIMRLQMSFTLLLSIVCESFESFFLPFFLIYDTSFANTFPFNSFNYLVHWLYYICSLLWDDNNELCVSRCLCAF